MNDKQLTQICGQISGQFPVTAFPASIFHERRWEVIGEVDAAALPLAPPYRIRVSETRGIILYNWPSLTASQQEQIHKAIDSSKEG